MKNMQISVNIDCCNPEHVEAANNFMRALGGLPFSEVITGKVPGVKITPVDEEEEEEESEADRKKRERKERADKRKAAEAKAAEEEEETEEEDDDDLLGDDDEEEEEITTAMLRKMTSAFVQEDEDKYKPKIQKELGKYGAKNVTSLDEKHFKAYHKFLTNLK